MNSTRIAHSKFVSPILSYENIKFKVENVGRNERDGKSSQQRENHTYGIVLYSEIYKRKQRKYCECC